MNVFKKK